MPVERGPARSLGSRLFRKQVLKVGSIPYEGRTLSFTRDYLKRLVDNFKAGAFDQVPFVLADERNRHTDDPERFRGDVRGLEFTGDGVDAIVELTEDGAKLIRDNPRLPVSARIVDEPRSDLTTPRQTPAVMHVCGTLDPRFNGLKDWEPSSDLSSSYAPEQVIDLTAETYQPMAGTDADTLTLTDEQRSALNDAKVPEDQHEAVAKIFAETDSEVTDDDRVDTDETDDKNKPSLKQTLRKLLGKSDDEVEQELQGLVTKDETETETETDKEPVTLSAEQKALIDLSAVAAADAKKNSERLERQLGEQRFKNERDERIRKGVPPALVELCKPVIERGPDNGVIELSAGQNFNAHDFVTEVLDEAEGMIDLSGPIGSSESDDPEVAKAKEIAADDEAWDS